MARWLIDSLATGRPGVGRCGHHRQSHDLLGLTTAVAAAFYRSAAAVRHRLWSLTLCGLFVLPVLSWLLPGWRLPIVPSTVGLIGSRASSNRRSRGIDVQSGANAGRCGEHSFSATRLRSRLVLGRRSRSTPGGGWCRHSRIRADDGRLSLVAGVHRGRRCLP